MQSVETDLSQNFLGSRANSKDDCTDTDSVSGVKSAVTPTDTPHTLERAAVWVEESVGMPSWVLASGEFTVHMLIASESRLVDRVKEPLGLRDTSEETLLLHPMGSSSKGDPDTVG